MAMTLPPLAQIAKEAGDIILKMQADIVTTKDWEEKPDGSQVAPADKKAHEIVCAGLEREFPGIAILSEEGDEKPNRAALLSNRLFATDPLDNTSGYIKGKNGWSVNIGLIENGVPTKGVIYFPAKQELYFTGTDGKAYLQKGDNPPEQISVAGPGSPVKVAVGFNEQNIPAFGDRPYEAKQFPAQERTCMVALGKCHITGVNKGAGGGFNVWDVAGPHAVLRAAGGELVDTQGRPIRYRKGEEKIPDHLGGGLETMAELGLNKNHVTTPEDTKAAWTHLFPWPLKDGHKYTRGHVLVIGGPLETGGAAKMAATSALRTAAGLVTVLAPDKDAEKTYIASSGVNALMWGTYDKLDRWLADPHVTSVIVGPGFGHGQMQETMLDKIVASKKMVLMDADALHKPRYNPNAVITPHENEFDRMFGTSGSREARALNAARLTGSIVLLKGSETVIAAPDGRIAVNPSATPFLGTAGSGDTLSGMIGGLLASGMPPFEAALAGAQLHARAGELAGPGLMADDLVGQIPKILSELSAERGRGTEQTTNAAISAFASLARNMGLGGGRSS